MSYWPERPAPASNEDEVYTLPRPGPPRYDVVEEANVVAWRVEIFKALGFRHMPAMALAVRKDVDRQVVADLLKAGATHDQVRGIVL